MTVNITYYSMFIPPPGDDTLLSTERPALHSPEMGSPPGLRHGVRNGDPQALPVHNVQSSPHIYSSTIALCWGRGLHSRWASLL